MISLRSRTDNPGDKAVFSAFVRLIEILPLSGSYCSNTVTGVDPGLA